LGRGYGGGVAEMTRDVEQVVLLGEDRQPVGAADKTVIHTDQTPLHLAFSCYVLGPDGRLLMTRRALSKLTWPGVWSNSVCGHPAPGEDVAEAIVRRGRQALGIEITDITPALPDFAYRAVDAGGTVENEVCPVFTARTSDQPDVDPAEVCEWHWAGWEDVVEVARRTPFLLSPWSVLQIPELAASGALDGG
jgi:isopentenyl-diphosphate delta-isomerase